MYQTFSVSTIKVDKATKQIMVAFTNDIEPSSINHDTLYISTGSNGDVVKIKWTIDGTMLVVDILDDIIPNLPYYLFITTDVTNILGEKLNIRVKQEILITSNVRNTCEILSPTNYQYIDDNVLNITIKEKKYDDTCELINSFTVQIATDHLFENIISDTPLTNSNAIKMMLNVSGQVYIRARIQSDKENYGKWSKSVVVNFEQENIQNTDDDILPIFNQEIEIVSSPEQGETPESFIIEFDCEIDERSIEDSILLLKGTI